MFLSVDTNEVPLRPSTSRIGEGDWKTLSKFWYPVAALPELGDQPFKAKLLDVDLVVYRSSDRLTVALDRCPHRWIRLSAGEVMADNLVCRFHGLAFNGDGQCVSVPALGRQAKLPSSYALKVFRSESRYGMLWACLDDASEEVVPRLPLLEEYDVSALVFMQVREWPMSAPRQVENFIDLAHLPWVHASTIGGDPHGRLQPARIEQSDDAVRMTTHLVETVPFEQPTDCELTFEVVLPFAIDFATTPEGGKAFRFVNIAAPTSHDSTRVYWIMARGAPGETHEDGPLLTELSGSDAVIAQQDIDTLSHLAIQEMPLNEKLEIHLPVDNVSTEYRKRLRKLGLGA